MRAPFVLGEAVDGGIPSAEALDAIPESALSGEALADQQGAIHN